jgi:hypothetical protein
VVKAGEGQVEGVGWGLKVEHWGKDYGKGRVWEWD